MSKKPAISFFCPAYNDEDNLPILIPKIVKLLQKVSSEFEVIIIEDASPDKTGEVADKLAKKYSPQVKVIHHTANRGYGGALLSGFEHANTYDYVFYTDGDNQYDVAVLPEMLRFVPKYDAVVGNRGLRELTWQRKMQSSCYNGLIRCLFQVHNPDINCAIKLIKRTSLDKCHLTSSSAFLPAELAIQLQKTGAKVKNMEVIHYPRIHGQASGGKLSVILPTFWEMCRYYIKSIFRSK